MGVRAMMSEVAPCMVMVVLEACTVGLTIMASTAISRGMSPFMFVVYSNALASVILLPYSFIFHKNRTEQNLFTLRLLIRIFFLGLTGITIAQNLAFVGLSYSSPILACGMGNLIPAFSFILTVILIRTTKLDWRVLSSQAKLTGTLVSILGAISVTLYKGPVINNHHALSLELGHSPSLFLFSSTSEHWVLGGIFLAVVSVIIERNPSAWRLKLNLDLIVIVLAAIFGSVIRSHVQIWFKHMKGPFYAPMFKPLGIPIASICGCIFFADSFHYGSMIGAFTIGMGYYTVMWGQIREDETQTNFGVGSMNSSNEKLPLLEEDTEV